MDYSTIPERLRRVANLKKFCEDSGLHRKTLQRIRKGSTSPSLDMCKKIAAALSLHRPAKIKEAA